MTANVAVELNVVNLKLRMNVLFILSVGQSKCLT